MHNTKKKAKVFIPLIVYGVLKGYIKKPALFMIKTMISYSKFMKKYNDRYPVDFLKTSAFMAHLYERLQNDLDKKVAFEVTRATFLTTATAVMQKNFRVVESERNFENLVKFQQKTQAEGVTKNNKMIITELTDNMYCFEVTKCMFYEFFLEVKMPELTSIMCSVDNLIFNTYLPNKIVFSRNVGETIFDGASQCKFKVSLK